MFVGVLFALLLCHIVFLDVTKRRILNFSVVLIFVFGALNLVFQGVEWMVSEWHWAAISSLIAFIFFYFFYATRLMGAGDVKLAAALAFCLGIEQFSWVWIVSAFLAVAYGVLCKLMVSMPITPTFLRLNPMVGKGIRFVPYGALMCVSVFIVIYANL